VEGINTYQSTDKGACTLNHGTRWMWASASGHFTPEERASSIYWMRFWMSPQRQCELD
jgi:hypothetical protein